MSVTESGNSLTSNVLETWSTIRAVLVCHVLFLIVMILKFGITLQLKGTFQERGCAKIPRIGHCNSFITNPSKIWCVVSHNVQLLSCSQPMYYHFWMIHVRYCLKCISQLYSRRKRKKLRES